MKRLHALAGLLALAATTAQAQNLKPGLWEMNSKMTSSSGQMEQAMAQAQAQMAAMPPAQRKMVEDMMAKQGVGMGAGNTNVVRVCLSPEMAAQGGVPQQTQGDCKTTMAPRSGNTTRVSFVCTNPPSSGEGTVTVLGPDSYSSKMTITTSAAGRPEKMNIDSTSKWLGADCGNLKPMPTTPPAKK